MEGRDQYIFSTVSQGFTELFKSIGLYLLPNLENLQPSFTQIYFQQILFSPSFWDANNMKVGPFGIFPQVFEPLHCVEAFFFLSFVQID